MLIACQACHRQYDVGSLPTGQHVRCACGELCEVPAPQVRDVATQHCSSCGGNVGTDDRKCGFCGSEVVLTERGLGDACPSCYKRLVKGAKFCSGCGTAITPQYVVKAVADSTCPRCDGQLNICETEGTGFHECTACGGIWLPEDQFRRVTQAAESSRVPGFVRGSETRQADRATRPVVERRVQYLKCPECDELMNRKNFAYSGVIIDWCRGHGYWFDAFELEAICRHVAEGGLAVAAEKDAAQREASARTAERRAERQAQRASMQTADGFGGGRRAHGTFDFGDVLGSLAELARWVVR